MQNDRELLAEYVRSGAENAFARIVSGNVGMVYSVCRRMLGDSHRSQDATQAVFFLLAQKAKSLQKDVVVAGWLHSAARNVCANLRRSELARRRHEMKAAKDNINAAKAVEEPDVDPAAIDEALGRLREAERDPILLRFFQGMSFSQVGEVLRISEDAAKKRTERALDRLRQLLTPARGTAMSSAALGALLASAAHATPPSLAAAATAAALHGVVPKALPLLVKGAIGMSAATKTQVAVAAIAAAILLGTGGVLMTMSIKGDKSASVVTVPAQAPGNAPRPVGNFADPLPPAILKLPDWIPGGATPMLMPRRAAEQRGLFFTIQAEHFDSRQGGSIAAPGLSNLGGGDWVCYQKVDLDQGANQFFINLSAGEVDPTSAIEVRLDSPTAQPLAVVRVKKTPDWSVFVTQSTPLAAASGIHDVYLTFTGPARVADVNWFKFARIPREASARLAANSYDDALGINDHDGIVSNLDRGDFLRFSQLDFGEGLETFEAMIGLGDRYSNGAPTARGQLEVRLDAVDGPVIGLLMVQPTGTFTNHLPQSTPITRTRGIHDVYLTFRSNGVGDLESITFKK